MDTSVMGNEHHCTKECPRTNTQGFLSRTNNEHIREDDTWHSGRQYIVPPFNREIKIHDALWRIRMPLKTPVRVTSVDPSVVRSTDAHVQIKCVQLT